ncbi:CHAT domain-containing protein [Leptothoe sp. PORK10 BA2]|nr:CHAT domain-containing protein [Leptothoe sp. PORK10 BA2]MEA5464592.1 CHAT domain-containing protein [Leptothoe sp. PORK10 BA2]
MLQLAQRLDANDPGLAADLANPPSLTQVRQIAQETNTTLVEYAQIFNDALYIWIVQPSGEITFRSVELSGNGDETGQTMLATLDGPVYRGAEPPSELDTLIADTRATVTVIRNNTSPEKLKALHQLLIDPIADLLPTDPTAQVTFIPQGSLFLVPFAALQDEAGTYLLEKHTILTAPSIQVLGLARGAGMENGEQEIGNQTDALVVGNPTMPKVWVQDGKGALEEIQLSSLAGAEDEALLIGDRLGVTPLLQGQATEAEIKRRLPGASWIHLATHGLLGYGDPQSSGVLDLPGAVALAAGNGEDGLLTAAEIIQMDLQAELAILSACDTGRGRITGDGVVGLSRALMTAGVPSVMVSLWAVPDQPTAELMTAFYEQLQRGETKAQALRQAMLLTMAQHPDPRNWAAFTLMGEGL